MLVYNDLTGKKEEFKSIEDNVVKIYVCGPTVYDSPHIGHARAAVAFDILRRYLLFQGYNVKFVSNYTDVDDKMINRANEEGITIKELAERVIEEYERVMLELNVIPPDIKPRATETIDAIQELIKVLIDKGYAYVSNGSVYFEVSKLEGYDDIFLRSKKKKAKAGNDDGNDSGVEEELPTDQDSTFVGEEQDEKRNERDFALWKKAKPGEPKWQSPWGEGRPGWHIECSAMVKKYLGELIDIHGGGKDLIFPHHTNEIAQTKAAYGTNLAKYWMHNGFVNIKGEKMSKSLKNFFTISEVLNEYSGNVLRLFLASVNYRSPINYTIENLKEAETNYNKFKNFYYQIEALSVSDSSESEDAKNQLSKVIKEARTKFIEALDDDLNTSEALSQVHKLIKNVNDWIFEKKHNVDAALKGEIISFMDDFSKIFGVQLSESQNIWEIGGYKAVIFGSENKEYLKLKALLKEKDDKLADLINLIVEVRSELRKNKQYKLSDKIRDKLKELGIELSDTKDKSYWKFI
ncbi:MAG: cysteine--tRNA ligase [Promethearchaeota archaeon]